MTELLKLAERVEAAEGPDRELDCLIGAALKLQPEGMDISAADSLRIWGLAAFARHAESRQNVWSTYLPRYTASLDAAMQLVPEGWYWRVGHSTLYQGWAHLNRKHPDFCDREDEHSAQANTPALALVAAALRARASS